MSVPKIVAAVIAVFLALTAIQTLCWRERPPEGWRPAWWQSRLWAEAGVVLLAPAWLAGGTASAFASGNSLHTTKVFIAVACLLYVVAAYSIVYLAARWFLKQLATNEPKT